MNMVPANLSALHVGKQFLQGMNVISVLKDVTASFHQGQSYAIMGVSGTGKSTLMHILAGLDTPSSGQMMYNGVAFDAMSGASFEQFLNKHIGLVFQVPYLIRELSVIENVMMPGMIAGHTRAACHERAYKLLTDVGIAEKAESKPASLSGGQQQRAVLARALFNNPSFLIADEPTGSLDSATGIMIIELLVQLQRTYGMGIIVSTHDTYVAQRMDHRFQLRDGILHTL